MQIAGQNNISSSLNLTRNDFGKIGGQPITVGIFYCRDSAGFSVSASNRLGG